MSPSRSLRGALALWCAACGCGHAAAPAPALVAPTPPPRDDGKSAKGGHGGVEHAAALEELAVGPLSYAFDRQRSVGVPLPDATHWLRVKFWGVPSLVAFRYGKDHHAVVGGFTLNVVDETAPGACSKAFEQWAQPWIDSFEVTVQHDPPRAFDWNGKIVDVDALVAQSSTLGEQEEYVAAYATYPAWPSSCLILGVAVPARNELARAKAVRDRFVADVLPKLQITAKDEPKERY